MSDAAGKGPVRDLRWVAGSLAGTVGRCWPCQHRGINHTGRYVYPVGEHLHIECTRCGAAVCLSGDCPPGDYEPSLALAPSDEARP
jgi:hypothetical protein